MATASEPTSKLFEQAFDSFRKATQSALQMQQESYGQYAKLWSAGFPGADTAWNSKTQNVQQEWANTVTDLMQKHRAMLDQQYRAGIKSLEEAFRVAESENPEQLRERCESLCRSALDLMKETSETQMQQFQEAMNKWIQVCQTKP
ncbi:hypothetical protein RMSM_07509 [Rhodopirellula maiorica SM1]|uniref:Phasin domain-containing protein n=1 Tax=Rhodopirellula maiorica SM1 TaxID=1265738 RepID=M5RNK6_9BACT|nr:hypothetical protein [Rhodopirellula maiorica]EMI15564.1 hypothetical protein RMSM_07509 [Rhodopirellula maiorica SM1]